MKTIGLAITILGMVVFGLALWQGIKPLQYIGLLVWCLGFVWRWAAGRKQRQT